MRNLLIVISTCSAIGLGVSSAFGEVTRPISGNHSIGEIAGTCKKSGGALWSMSDGYGCLKGNCDGKGGECNVKCDNSGKCTGTTPTIQTGKQLGTFANPGAALTATTNKSAGTKSTDGGVTTRANQPGLLERQPGLSPTGPSPIGTPMGTGAAPAGSLR